ncbi:transposase [Pseudomonas brassicacearum]
MHFFGGHIRFCGNGCLGFRPDGGSLLKSPGAGPVKSKQNAFAPPLDVSPRLGIHVEVPTAQCLRSASVV